MGTIVSIASGKGGVGKTLITASLGIVLNRLGCKVLMADGDMGLRNLDLVLGLQDEVLYDAIDVARQKCEPAEALLNIRPGLDFLAASQKHVWEKINIPAFQHLLEHLSKQYDYVLVDSPPGRGHAFKSASSVADETLFVVAPSWTSLRDTGRVMQYYDKHRNFNYAVLFNNFYRQGPDYVSLDDAIQTLDPEHIAGVLPHDDTIVGASQHGSLAEAPTDSPFLQAMEQTAGYLLHHTEPDWEQLKTLLPVEPEGTPAAEEFAQPEPADAEIEPDSSCLPEAEPVPCPSLSLRNRRSQSQLWRTWHR